MANDIDLCGRRWRLADCDCVWHGARVGPSVHWCRTDRQLPCKSSSSQSACGSQWRHRDVIPPLRCCCWWRRWRKWRALHS